MSPSHLNTDISRIDVNRSQRGLLFWLFARGVQNLSLSKAIMMRCRLEWFDLCSRGVGYDLEIGYNCLLHECHWCNSSVTTSAASATMVVCASPKRRKCYSLKWVQQFEYNRIRAVKTRRGNDQRSSAYSNGDDNNNNYRNLNASSFWSLLLESLTWEKKIL